MKLLLVGGSNTVMKSGYVDQTLEILGDQISSVTNIAVGGSPCVLGLDQMRGVPDIESCDAVIIEYMINDCILVKRPGDGKTTWLHAYEGLIRYLRRRNPGLRIISVLFGRRHKTFFEVQDYMRAEIVRLSAHYACHVIDIDGHFRSQYKGNMAGYEALYVDAAHYRRPDVTQIIADIVAPALKAVLDAPAPSGDLPTALTQPPFDEADYVELSTKASEHHPVKAFTNRRYTKETLFLKAGEEISLDDLGQMVVISYVSGPDSCALLIRETDRDIVIDTLHSEVAEGKYAFLIKGFPMTRGDWTKGRRGKIVLKAIDNTEREACKSQYAQMYNMVEPKAITDESGVFLLNIMHI